MNGNGATPPRTPPGTPKKTLSRSSSPKPIPGKIFCHGTHNFILHVVRLYLMGRVRREFCGTDYGMKPLHQP